MSFCAAALCPLRSLPNRANAGMAGGSVRCDPSGVDVDRFQVPWYQESTRAAPEIVDSTGSRAPERENSHRGTDLQTVRSGQLSPQTLQDFHQLLALCRLDLEGQCVPAECVRDVLALRKSGPVRAGQPAAERRRAGGLGLGGAILPETTQDFQSLHQSGAAHHSKLIWQNHQECVKGNATVKQLDKAVLYNQLVN